METNTDKRNTSIAVFDSGIGGLNLLKKCVYALPNAQLYYVADNYNVPYGAKRKEEILALVKNKLDLVAFRNLSAAVIACNTATANCIEELRALYPFPIVGIQPAIKPAAQLGGKCLVLATPATVRSASFSGLLSRCPHTDVVVYECKGLADFIERNVFDLRENEVEELLPHVKADTVVLGCTHYIFIKDLVRKRYNCPVFDGIEGTVDHLCKILGMNDHYLGNSGTADHINSIRSDITFLGGNFAKNANIFSRFINIDR